MDKRSGRTVFWLGLLLYTASFFLPMSVGWGIFASERPSVAGCAVDWFFFPWIYAHLNSMGNFLTDAPIENVSIAVSGWINPVFGIAWLFQVVGKTHQLTKMLRNVILLMLPFCWIVFLSRHVYPREGYFLWTGGMLLVLFSSELENRQSALESASV